MIVLALDIAVNTGWAYGPADGQPVSGSVRTKRPHEDREVAPGNLHCFLRDKFEEWALFDGIPDMVFVEHWLNPVAQPSADAAILQLFCHGAAQGFFRSHGLHVHQAMPATIRKHFIGTSKVPAGSKAGEIKRMVRDRCAALKYVERTCVDFDRTDALAAWDYACHVHGKRAPAQLVMHGEAV